MRVKRFFSVRTQSSSVISTIVHPILADQARWLVATHRLDADIIPKALVWGHFRKLVCPSPTKLRRYLLVIFVGPSTHDHSSLSIWQH